MAARRVEEVFTAAGRGGLHRLDQLTLTVPGAGPAALIDPGLAGSLTPGAVVRSAGTRAGS
ncbi:hypothetical protein [Streptomyces sp. NPDC002133]|uniref:hypothetical protein n=1 Tax=Streptomyces sp. NPDC002133 TaxID=3154409 RepID=UPI003324325D